jgi:hypothetical protein
MNTIRCPLTLLAVAALTLLSACGGGGGGSASQDMSMSTLNLGITDAPLDGATKVWVQFTGVEVKPVSANPVTFSFSPARGFDLLTLSNGQTATFLDGATVPAGEYEWVRLMIDTAPGSSYVINGTGQHNLNIPSGFETGLKLIQGFTMPAGGVANFTIDFSLARSIVAPPGKAPDYMMKPVLRMLDNTQVGMLTGTFAPATLAAQTGCGTHAPVVYVYTGSGVTPDDIYVPSGGQLPAVQPLVTAMAKLNSGSTYAYMIAFMPAGTYTIAFTCEVDDAAIHESALAPPTIHFVTYPTAVTISNGMTTTANF